MAGRSCSARSPWATTDARPDTRTPSPWSDARRADASAAVLAGLPAAGGEMRLGEGEGAVLELRRQGVVPAVEKAEEGDDGDDLEDLRLGEMRAGGLEMLRAGAVRDLGGGLGEGEGGALGRREARRGRVLPDRLD